MTLLGTMQPTSKFGEVFQYSNLMAAAGGLRRRPRARIRTWSSGAPTTMRCSEQVFGPLGMTTTDLRLQARAGAATTPSPHGEDVDGKPAVAAMDLNYSFVPVRPAGGAWTSAHDLCATCRWSSPTASLPDGTTLVSEEDLLARRAPQVPGRRGHDYGMGLMVDTGRGACRCVHHGGDLTGFHSDMMWLPEHGVGAVILTNSDTGVCMRRAVLQRACWRCSSTAKPEAETSAASAVRAAEGGCRQAERERLVVPADARRGGEARCRLSERRAGRRSTCRRGRTARLASTSASGEAGRLAQERRRHAVVHDDLAGRPRDSSSSSRAQDGKRLADVRDSQHEYAVRRALTTAPGCAGAPASPAASRYGAAARKASSRGFGIGRALS